MLHIKLPGGALLLLKAGYGYVPCSSLERVIEENKEQYYLALRRTQKTICSDNSILAEWTLFFLRSLRKQIAGLKKKLERENILTQLSPSSQALLLAARERGTLTVREAVQLTGGNRNTIKQHLRQLVQQGLLRREGKGKGSWCRPA